MTEAPPAPARTASPIPSATPPSATPAPAAPTAAPKPTVPDNNLPAPTEPVKPSPNGMKGFIDSLGKPAPKAEDNPAVVPAVEPAVPAATKPAEVEDSNDVTDDIWNNAPKKLKGHFFKTRRELQEKISATEKRIQELEGKSSQSPADLKRIKELEERSATLEKDLSDRENRLMQADYSKSKEFEEKYVKRGQKTYQQAVGDISKLMVEDGSGTARQATQADFDEIRGLPPGEQDKRIHDMFGNSAYRVLHHLRAIEAIEGEAQEAIENARIKSEENRRAEEKKRGEYSSEFEGHFNRENETLLKHPTGYFAPIADNPEASAALENGYKWVDETFSNAAKMPPKEAAESKATLRALAAFAPRAMVELKQKDAKIASLMDELSKYRASGPGSAPAATGAAPAPTEEPRGIQAMVDRMKNLKPR